MTLDKIADMISNSVMAGLKGVTNFAFSKEQLRDEVIISSNRFLQDLALKGMLSSEGLYQDINCIELECKDIGECCEIDTYEKVLMSVNPLPKIFHITGIKPIMYLGLPGKNKNFELTTQLISGEYNKYTFSGQVGLTTAYINNNHHVIVRNPPSNELKYISTSAIFENPEDVYNYECMCTNVEKPFQRPQWLIDQVVGKLVNDYMRYYRMGGITQPNMQEQADLQSKGK